MSQWTVAPNEQPLIMYKQGANQLGFALLLKFFQIEGRFPTQKNEIPRVAQEFVAAQLDLDAGLYQDYNWQGRTVKSHRVAIRNFLHFRPANTKDFNDLHRWLIENTLPKEKDERQLKQKLYQHLQILKIEPPSPGRIERLLKSAQRQFEAKFYESILEKLPQACQVELDKLIGTQEDSYTLDPDEIPLNQLKAESGSVSVNSLLSELVKLDNLQKIGIPEQLFSNLPQTAIERYRLRVETESLTELRRHPKTVQYTLLAAFCWLRSQEVIDTIIELLIQLVHRIDTRAQKRVSDEVLTQLKSTHNHDRILYEIALASLAQPEGGGGPH